MISNRWWRLSGGFALASLLVATATSYVQAQPQPTAAADGRRLADQTADTQALFRAVWGQQADQQWVVEHNAELARLAPPPTGTSAVAMAATDTPMASATEAPAATAVASMSPVTATSPTTGPTSALPTTGPTSALPTTGATSAPTSVLQTPISAPTAPATRAPGRTGGGTYP
jgi:hypothetical protein